MADTDPVILFKIEVCCDICGLEYIAYFTRKDKLVHCIRCKHDQEVPDVSHLFDAEGKFHPPKKKKPRKRERDEDDEARAPWEGDPDEWKK